MSDKTFDEKFPMEADSKADEASETDSLTKNALGSEQNYAATESKDDYDAKYPMAATTTAATGEEKTVTFAEDAKEDEYEADLTDVKESYRFNQFKTVESKKSALFSDHDKVDAFLHDEEAMAAAGGTYSNIHDEYQDKQDSRGLGYYCRCCALSNCCRLFPEAGFMQVMKYAQSGDLVLFDNKCNLGTCIISCFTRSDWDHVAMVFRKPGGKPHEVYLVEALNPKVEIAYLKDIMECVTNYDGEGVMYWRPLKHPGPVSPEYPNGKIDPELEAALFNAAVSFKDRHYQSVFEDMVNATVAQDEVFWTSIFGDCCCESFGLKKYDEEEDAKNSEELFCSELVARCYTMTGLLDDTLRKPSQNYLPKDFSSDPHATIVDALKSPYELKPEFRIVRKLQTGYEYDPEGANAVHKSQEEEDQPAPEGKGRSTFSVWVARRIKLNGRYVNY